MQRHGSIEILSNPSSLQEGKKENAKSEVDRKKKSKKKESV